MAPKIKHIKRKRYSNSHKLEIAKLAQEPGNNVASIARAEGLPESTVRNWLKDFERLDTHVKSHGDLKTIHKDKIPTLTSVLRSYCEDGKVQDPPIPLTAQSVSNKAASISFDLLKEYEQHGTDIMDENEATALKKMVFSTSWAHDWGHRHFIFPPKHGKKDPEVVAMNVIETFKTEVSQYDQENLYCLADPGLYYRVLPRESYVTKTDNVMKSSNSMKLKDRITIYICTNATGNQKIPLAMIGNAKNPRVLGKDNRKELFKYYSQEKAWSDQKTYKKWFDEVFLPYIRSITTAKILLIVPFVSDDVLDETKQVKCVTMPSNTTAFQPPLSLEVISSVIRVYRYNLLNEILYDFNNREQQRNEAAKMLAGTAGLAEGREPHILNVMEMLDDAWKNLCKSIIYISWAKSGLLGDPHKIPAHFLQRNPITEQLQAATDSILFGLKNLELPADSAQDDPLIESVRATLSLYKNMAEDAFVKEIESWVHLEDAEEVLELIRNEREQCLSQEEEKYCETIKSIQDALSDSRYASAVEFLQRARNEIHRTVRLKRTTMKTEDSDEVIKV